MIDLVLAVNVAGEQLSRLSIPEILRVLRPGGRAVLRVLNSSSGDGGKGKPRTLDSWAKAAGSSATAKTDDQETWLVITAPARRGVDWWSHWEHGPDNNPVSTDTVIRAPHMTQWLGTPLYITMPAITTAASGNVISPAAYDLETGKYLSGSPGNGAPRFNRGEEVAVLQDRFIIQGGRLRFSAVRNYVNPGAFAARAIHADGTLGPPVRLCTGKIEPAWDARIFVRVDGVSRPPECFRLAELIQNAKPGNARKQPKARDRKQPGMQWTAMALRGSDVLSLALARNAVVTVCQTTRPRNRLPFWRLCVLDRDNRSVSSQINLPSEPVPGREWYIYCGKAGRRGDVLPLHSDRNMAVLCRNSDGEGNRRIAHSCSAQPLHSGDNKSLLFPYQSRMQS